MQKVKNGLRAVGLLICIIVMVSFLSNVLSVRATTDTGFYKLQKNTVDVLFLGNCHAYSTFIPSVIEMITGKTTYVLGGSSQSIPLTYYNMKEALKRQSPEYIVLETFPIIIYDSYIPADTEVVYAYSAFADIPFSFDKLLYATDYKDGSEWFYLLFDLGYFHDRWEVIQDFKNKKESHDNGYVVYWNNQPLSDPEELLKLEQTDHCLEIAPDYLEYVYRIIDLAQNNGIRLIFTTVPYTSMTYREAARLNTLNSIAAEYNIPYINFAKEELVNKLDFERGYMIDDNHVNEQGGLILSEYMGNVLKEMDQIQTAAA